MGDFLVSRTVSPFTLLAELKSAAEAGSIDIDGVGSDWLLREAPALNSAELLVCSEPFWLCPLLAVRRQGRMLGVLHMALLNEFPFEDEQNLHAFWVAFHAMIQSRRVLLSSACRLTGEQVVHQTGVRVPYVPFMGLGVDARFFPAASRRALFFRNNRPHMIAFRAALRLFLQTREPSPMHIVDMNDVPRTLTYQEIASFHAVVMLPHGPNALRLSDLYAAGVPIVVPGEPLVHKFVWASRTFAGLDAEFRYYEVAPNELRQDTGSTQWRAPYSPFNFVRGWSMHRFIDDRRYWYQYTEWATLPELVRFRSIPDLIVKLEELTRESAKSISVRMASHHAVLAADALGWWRAALGELLLHGRA